MACRPPCQLRTRPCSRTALLNLAGATAAGFAGRRRTAAATLRRHPCSGYCRQHPRRPGLGSVPVAIGSLAPYNPRWPSTACPRLDGHPEDKWGGAVNVALQIKNIPWCGRRDQLAAVYTDGAKAVISRAWPRELLDVRWHELSGCVSEHWLCQRSGWCLPGLFGRKRLPGHQDGGCLWCPRWLQPQLGSLLDLQPLWCYAAPVRNNGKAVDLRERSFSAGRGW